MTASAAKDQEFFQKYSENLTENEDVEENKFIQSIKADLEVEQNNATTIVDADGNSCVQTSEKMVKVEPLRKISQSDVKNVAAEVVTRASKRKNTAQSTLASDKKSKLASTIVKQIKMEENIEKSPNETITSEDEIYEFDENEQDPDDPINLTATSDTPPFQCMICRYQANKKILLTRHLKTHSDDRPYKCSVCEKCFKTNASLISHRNTHLGVKPYGCKDCKMAFTSSGELVRHSRYRHTLVKPYKCTECDYSSVERSKLLRHMRCHTGEKPYQCPQCTYASPDTFKLKRHMRIHTGEKPYECDICHARFTQSNSLKQHRPIHSDSEKPVFQCHLCPTTCGRKTDLRLHIKTLHSSDKRIPCKRCGQELPDRYTYKMHIKTHENEKCNR